MEKPPSSGAHPLASDRALSAPSSAPPTDPASPATPVPTTPPLPPKRRNFRNFVASIRYSIAGFREALRHEPSFREDLLFAAALVPFAVILPVNAVSTALMIAALFLIIIVELLNSAIEWTIDYLRPEHHPLARRIKDMASAAVFLSYLNCIAVWAILLWPGTGVWKRLAAQFAST